MIKPRLILMSVIFCVLHLGNLNAQPKLISFVLSTSDSASGLIVWTKSGQQIFSVGADKKVSVEGANSEFKARGQLTVVGTSEFRNFVTINSSGCYLGTWNQCSDLRLKKNISLIPNALNKIIKLNGVSFNWRSDEFPQFKFDDRTNLGFVAQDIEKIFPELVRNESNGYKSVSYSNLAPVLVEAIKEQQKIIDSQKSELMELKSETEALRKEIENIKALLNR